LDLPPFETIQPPHITATSSVTWHHGELRGSSDGASSQVARWDGTFGWWKAWAVLVACQFHIMRPSIVANAGGSAESMSTAYRKHEGIRASPCIAVGR